jgi:hypothetical protein
MYEYYNITFGLLFIVGVFIVSLPECFTKQMLKLQSVLSTIYNLCTHFN